MNRTKYGFISILKEDTPNSFDEVKSLIIEVYNNNINDKNVDSIYLQTNDFIIEYTREIDMVYNKIKCLNLKTHIFEYRFIKLNIDKLDEILGKIFIEDYRNIKLEKLLNL